MYSTMFYCNRDGLFSIDPVKGIDDRENGYAVYPETILTKNDIWKNDTDRITDVTIRFFPPSWIFVTFRLPVGNTV